VSFDINTVKLTPRWCVAHTQPHAEAKATRHLQRQGFEIYFPRYLKRRRHARSVDIVAAPLFPRYLFVAIDMTAQRWRSIFSTVGVSHIVCNGDLPAAIPGKVVTALKDREDADGFIRLDHRPNFRSGDKIRVIDGVFADCFGLYEGMQDSERVAILLDLLGRKVRVMVDMGSVAAA
jgi:transcriptional antiterminator RfaH